MAGSKLPCADSSNICKKCSHREAHETVERTHFAECFTVNKEVNFFNARGYRVLCLWFVGYIDLAFSPIYSSTENDEKM
eukprot:scaffold1223_cov151-Amphora_coffeaeformis.AAC.10